VGPRAGLDAEVRGKILCLCLGSNPVRPVHSQRLSYPTLKLRDVEFKMFLLINVSKRILVKLLGVGHERTFFINRI
jgi:hypothetical protein